MSSNDPIDTFREEAGELLDQLEAALIRLEADPQNGELIDEAFRSLHTIKGSGNMFGLNPLVSFTHTVEAAFALVRDGESKMDKRLIDLGLQARDQIAELVARPEPSQESAAAGEAILDQIRRTFPTLSDGERSDEASDGAESDGFASGESVSDVAASDGTGGETTFRVRFLPKRELFLVGTNPLLLLKELKELGEALVIGYEHHVPPLAELDPEGCYLGWDILLTTSAGKNAVRDVFIFVEDNAEIQIEEIDSGSIEDSDLDYKRLGEILVARGDLAADDVEKAATEKNYLGDLLVSKGLLSAEQVDAALKEQAYVRERRENRRRSQGESSSSIKVSTEKLDSLVNLVGEFVSVHATLQGIAGDGEDIALRGVSERLESLIRDVRDIAMDLHMVPVDILFATFRRLIRDLSRELGKEVSLELEGTDTEMDKNIIDRLKDPMLHIIRNSLDHGIEMPEEREAAGKPREGRLHVSATYSGASVLIRVSDDGGGIDADAVRRKAIERGLIGKDESLDDNAVTNLIFAPGFSTTESATNVSGRGVGMDVVRSNIESLGGTIGVESEAGKGTVMNLRIPLTMAIIEGLLVRVSGQYYLVNIANVLECLEFTDVTRHSGNQALIEYRGTLIPYLHLRDHFALAGRSDFDVTGDRVSAAEVERNGSNVTNGSNEAHDHDGVDHRQILVVSSDGRTMGIVVDEVLDTFQSVIKSLGKMYEGVSGVSGAVLLGNGQLALLLDVDRLTRTVARRA